MPKSIVDKDMFSNLNLCQWNMVLTIANLSQKEKKMAMLFTQTKLEVEESIARLWRRIFQVL